MLNQLTIQNFALIDRLSLDFHERLNILTGETGAGKSVVIDALRGALGGRIQTSDLRDPKSPSIIEAVFTIADENLRAQEVFQEYFMDDDATLIIHRTFLPDGKNKIKINGTTVTIGQLKTIGNHLMDFHGPHDHQMLLSEEYHRMMLDRLIDFGSLRRDYQKEFQQYSLLQKQYEDLQAMAQTRERELDLLAHQVKELEQVPLDDAHYQNLLAEQTKANNAEKLYASASQLLEILDGDNQSLADQIRQAFGPLKTLTNVDEATAKWSPLLNQLQEVNNDLVLELRDYMDGLSFSPQDAERINAQCDLYDDIKRKYGASLDEAKTFYTEAKRKFDILNHFEQEDAQLKKDIKTSQEKLTTIAQSLTKKRKAAAKTLKTTIEKELTELGIAHVKFEARVEVAPFHSDGADAVTFYISPNAGMDLKPLAEIVSSGEAARVMLALKKALMDVDPIPVLIFDEIDAQIGGRLGTITGQKLREIAQARQVLLITHLPQIASFADGHFKVTKTVQNGKAITNVTLLDKKSRVEELAKMMSGDKESKIAVEHAQDLLGKAAR